jgi:hypothetical protein
MRGVGRDMVSCNWLEGERGGGGGGVGGSVGEEGGGAGAAESLFVFMTASRG